jgi:hypothetical protein
LFNSKQLASEKTSMNVLRTRIVKELLELMRRRTFSSHEAQIMGNTCL